MMVHSSQKIVDRSASRFGRVYSYQYETDRWYFEDIPFQIEGYLDIMTIGKYTYWLLSIVQSHTGLNSRLHAYTGDEILIRSQPPRGALPYPLPSSLSLSSNETKGTDDSNDTETFVPPQSITMLTTSTTSITLTTNRPAYLIHCLLSSCTTPDPLLLPELPATERWVTPTATSWPVKGMAQWSRQICHPLFMHHQPIASILYGQLWMIIGGKALPGSILSVSEVPSTSPQPASAPSVAAANKTKINTLTKTRHRQVHCYDTVTRTWEQMNDFPPSLTNNDGLVACVWPHYGAQSTVYAFNGCPAPPSAGDPPPFPLYGQAAYILAATRTSQDVQLADYTRIWRYDPRNDSWSMTHNGTKHNRSKLTPSLIPTNTIDGVWCIPDMTSGILIAYRGAFYCWHPLTGSITCMHWPSLGISVMSVPFESKLLIPPVHNINGDDGVAERLIAWTETNGSVAGVYTDIISDPGHWHPLFSDKPSLSVNSTSLVAPTEKRKQELLPSWARYGRSPLVTTVAHVIDCS
jgi:hypothetical protein